MQVHAGESTHRHANGVLRTLRAPKESRFRLDGEFPRPDRLKSDSVSSYSRSAYCELNFHRTEPDRRSLMADRTRIRQPDLVPERGRAGTGRTPGRGTDRDRIGHRVPALDLPGR